MPDPILTLAPHSLYGKLAKDPAPAPLPDSTFYTAPAVGDALVYRFPQGTLSKAQWLVADFLLDGLAIAHFQLSLYEPKLKDGSQRIFRFSFNLLNQCAARLRVPLEAVNQNQWSFLREGACLKRMAGGDRVDLNLVEQITLGVNRKAEGPVRFCMTSLRATAQPPEPLKEPLLPRGKLLDEMGQSTIHAWPAKTPSIEQCTARLKKQLEDAPQQKWPANFNQWGGAKDLKLANPPKTHKPFFTTHHDGQRWYLLDPTGQPFWSAGLDSVRPDVSAAYAGLETAVSLPPRDGEYKSAFSGRWGETFNPLTANFIRAFGAPKWFDAWGAITLAHLRAWGFNTVANWSEWQIAQAAGFPYVRPLSFRPNTARIYRDFPDVFSPTLDADAAALAKQLEPTRDDKALIGYFLMNEPTWGFASETPAAGMLYTHANSHTRDHFATWLAEKYKSDAALAAAWNMPDVTLAKIASGKWDSSRRLNPKARPDCAEFSTLMVERYFKTLSAACKKADPNHLNLGARYHTVPPPWALKGMTSFDVFSINCYQERVPPAQLKTIASTLGVPVIIGEYHFGALDVGLPASGIGRVATQADRGKAFRVYTETAAALPECVGVHYFTLYDQSALGRFDGENYNIGFLDVCNLPYAPLAQAARATHERLYAVTTGREKPFEDAPKYLPKLF